MTDLVSENYFCVMCLQILLSIYTLQTNFSLDLPKITFQNLIHRWMSISYVFPSVTLLCGVKIKRMNLGNTKMRCQMTFPDKIDIKPLKNHLLHTPVFFCVKGQKMHLQGEKWTQRPCCTRLTSRACLSMYFWNSIYFLQIWIAKIFFAHKLIIK